MHESSGNRPYPLFATVSSMHPQPPANPQDPGNCAADELQTSRQSQVAPVDPAESDDEVYRVPKWRSGTQTNLRKIPAKS